MRLFTSVKRCLNWLIRAERITRLGKKYMTRLRLFGNRVYLHRFHDGDTNEFHDHPWPFVSLILWGGYWEVTPSGRRWYGPGSVLRRPAEWIHRVELGRIKPITIVYRGLKRREWGFYCPQGWIHWTEYNEHLTEKGAGCGE